MRVGEKILATLEKDRTDLNNGSSPYLVEIKEQGLKIGTELIDLDRLGCVLCQITFQAEEADAQPLDANRGLEHMARQIGERITYLLEGLALVEWDKNSSTLLMRSQPPESNSRYIGYYELLLSQGPYLALTRYRYDRGAGCRSQEPINLTREVFVRLIDDLATIIKTPEPEQ